MKKLVQAAGLLIFAGLIALVGAEAIVRSCNVFMVERAAVRYVPRQTAQNLRPVSISQLHPFLGWSDRPQTPLPLDPVFATRLFAHAGSSADARDVARTQANSLGFYSPLWDYRLVQPGEFVVGVFGGSVAGWLAVVGSEDLRTALARRLNMDRASVRILNFALGGYKQPQQLHALTEALLLGIPLDVVVNIDGLNEVVFGGQDALIGFHPVFPSRQHLASAIGISAFGEMLSIRDTETMYRIAREKQLAAQVLDAVHRSWIGRTELGKAYAGAMSLAHGARAARLEKQLQEHLALNSTVGDIMPSLSDPCLGVPDACWDLIGALWFRSSLMMDAVSRRFGAKYAHLLQPNQYVSGSKQLTDEERATAYDPTPPWSQSVMQGYPVLQERGRQLKDAGVAFVDLTQLFSDRTDTIYIDTCCHYNATGIHLLVEAVATHVAALYPSQGDMPSQLRAIERSDPLEKRLKVE